MSMFKWEVVDPAPGQAVLPMQRLPWGKTIGLGAQHVVAMFGATFVFPLVMGLDPNLAIMFSGICTILFLLIVQNRVPSYLGTSASFVASVAAIRALDEGNDSSYVTGAILVGGLVLAAVGVLVHFAGAQLIHRILPPAVTGAVVMLIGFNLAPVVAGDLLAPGPVDRPADGGLHGLRGRGAPRLLVAHRGLPRPDLRLRAVLARRPRPRSDHLRPRRRHRGDRARPRLVGRRRGRQLDRPAERHPRRRRLGRPRPVVLAHRDPARPARRHRARRGEHRPRQGRRRDDRRGPRPLHGPRDRCRRHRDRLRQRVRWLARPRRTPRTSASWARPGSTPRPPTTSLRWSPSCSASARSSARSSTRRPAASWAASRLSSTG